MAQKSSSNIIGARVSTSFDLTVDRLVKELNWGNRVAAHLQSMETGGGSSPYIIAFAKAADATRRAPQIKPGPKLAPTDSPGVTILDIAQNYASQQRIRLREESLILEDGLRSGTLKPEDIAKILRWETLEWNGKIISSEEFKDRAKRYFEALIWTLLLLAQAEKGRGMTNRPITTPLQVFNVVGNRLEHVSEALQSYWVTRFINPKTDKLFSEVPVRTIPTPARTVAGDSPIISLREYMLEIARNAKREGVFLSLGNEAGLVAKKNK